MGRIIEGYWDCKYCDSKGISGSIRECPNCGHPRDDTVKFYLKDEKKYVSEEKAKTNLALWATTLKFNHPVSKQRLTFKVFPPQEEKPWKDFDIEKFMN